MAVVIKEGNVFDSDAKIICHQVNCQGVMGGSTHRLHLKLLFLSEVEVSGIPGVAVKCVEIRRNIGGEGGLLGLY